MNVPSSSRAAPMYLSETQFDQEWCRRRRIPSCNPYVMLQERERGRALRGNRNYTGDFDFYSTIRLDRNFPVGFEPNSRDCLMGWTPDGKYMISCNGALRIVKVQKYLGVERAIDALPEDFLMRVFDPVGEAAMPFDGQIKQEGLYFTCDSKFFVVVAITSLRGPETSYNLDRIYSHTESLPLASMSLEDYTFVSVNVETGKICGTYRSLADRVSLTHGVNLCGRYLMISSHHQQIIHIVQVESDTGKLVPLRVLGYTIHDDDSMYLYGDLHDSYLRTEIMSGLKQRINTFLFERAKKQGRIPEFLRGANYRSNLRIDRVGLFDDFFLLIRMLPFHIITSNNDGVRDPNILPCFYVVMDWRSADVLEVFEDFDSKFLNFYEDSPERMAFPMSDTCWPGAEQFRRIAFQSIYRYRKRVVRSQSDSRRRILNQLPLPSLHASKVSLQSPYLDPKLFQIDDRCQIKMLSGKMQADYHENKEIRISSRRTNMVFLRLPLSGLPESNNRQVTMLFHPTDPLCIAIERQRQNPAAIVYLPAFPDICGDGSQSTDSSPKSTDPESSENSSSQF